MDRFGTSISQSPHYSLAVGQTIVSTRMDPVVVPSMGVLVANCRVNTNTELYEFDYSP